MARYDRAWQMLDGFARVLVHRPTIRDALDPFVGALTEALEVTGCAVRLLDESGTRLATPARIVELEEAEDRERRGPRVAALRSGAPVLVARLADREAEWPEYVARARRFGIAAVAAMSMPERVGTFELYCAEPCEWDADDVRIAEVFGNVLASYAITMTESERHRRTSEQLQAALDSRVLIEQAKGMVAAQRSVSPDQAFSLLRKHANDRNATLRSVADAVVRLGLRV